MKCHKCNIENSPGAKFCRGCGSKCDVLPPSFSNNMVVCAQCAHANKKGKKFCETCGSSLAVASTLLVENAAEATCSPPLEAMHESPLPPSAQISPGAYQANPSNTAKTKTIAGLIGAAVVLSILGGGALYLTKNHGASQPAVELAQSAGAIREKGSEVERASSAGQVTTTPPKQAGASVEAVSAPVGRPGDVYTYETIDHEDSKLNNVTSREVVSVNGQETVMKFVNAKSGYTRFLTYDSQLGLMGSRYGANEGVDYRPAVKYFTFPARLGDTWNATSTETNIKTGKTRLHVLAGRVEGFETIAVPAGTFRALKVILDSEVREEGRTVTGRDVSWYAPDVRRTVKSELESRENDTGKTGRRTVNLISYRLQ